MTGPAEATEAMTWLVGVSGVTLTVALVLYPVTKRAEQWLLDELERRERIDEEKMADDG